MDIKGDVRKFVRREELHFGRVSPGTGNTADNLSGITDDNDIAVKAAQHRERVHDIHRATNESGLFFDFAADGIGDGLIGLNESTGETPAPESGLDVSLYEKKTAFQIQNGRD
jgi:hypothetical protein